MLPIQLVILLSKWACRWIAFYLILLMVFLSPTLGWFGCLLILYFISGLVSPFSSLIILSCSWRRKHSKLKNLSATCGVCASSYLLHFNPLSYLPTLQLLHVELLAIQNMWNLMSHLCAILRNTLVTLSNLLFPYYLSGFSSFLVYSLLSSILTEDQ